VGVEGLNSNRRREGEAASWRLSSLARAGGKRTHAAAALLVACVRFGGQCVRGHRKAGEQSEASDRAMMRAAGGEMECRCVRVSLKKSRAHLELAGCSKVGRSRARSAGRPHPSLALGLVFFSVSARKGTGTQRTLNSARRSSWWWGLVGSR
jgi:hypothetical protein